MRNPKHNNDTAASTTQNIFFLLHFTWTILLPMAAALHRRPFLLLLLFSSSLIPLSTSGPDEVQTLLKLKASFTQAQALDSWVAAANKGCPDEWVGIVCYNGLVSGLRLQSMSLSGKIDVEALLQLSGLRTISLSNNSFSGSIPEFNKLGALRALYLSNNQFSGEISNDYFTQMGSLKKLWLDHNQFSGKLPESLTQHRSLIELHAENNQFSGNIPQLKDGSSITSINLSNNKLEGQIPESYSKFGPDAFGGNDGVCGKFINKDCDATEHNKNKVAITVAVIAFLIFFISVFLVLAKRRDHDEFSVLGKESPNRDEVVQVHVPRDNSVNAAKRTASSRKGGSGGGGGESHKLRSASKRRTQMGDLEMVNDEKGAFGLPDLMKAAAEVLGNGGLGSAYKAMMSSGLGVVVKRMREMNKLSRDSFDVELRRLGALRHPNILPPLAYHYRREEKLVVSEYMPKGSLLYVLHGDRGISHSQLDWPTRLKIIKGIASGMGFLHTEFKAYELPHGNLKSSNVLLNEKYDAVLSDYAFHPMINTGSLAQALFAYKSPEYIKSQNVSQKSDVYCLGIIILETLTGKFPSQYVSNGKGGMNVVEWVQQALEKETETEVIDPEIASNTNSLGMMVKLMEIGAECVEEDEHKRLKMSEAIKRIDEVQVCE